MFKSALLLLFVLSQQQEFLKIDSDFLKIDHMLNEEEKIAWGLSQKVTFVPNVPQTFNNPLFFQATIHCQISTPDASDSGEINIIKGSAKCNG